MSSLSERKTLCQPYFFPVHVAPVFHCKPILVKAQ